MMNFSVIIFLGEYTMVMQNQAQQKKMRVPLIIMVIMLAVGLVGSFAIWSSPNAVASE